jgi:hypothetical protein
LNLGGRTVYVALAVFPRNKLKDPMMPLSADGLKPGICQHSIVEMPSLAAIAVRFSDGVVSTLNCAPDKSECATRIGSSSDEKDRRVFMVMLKAEMERRLGRDCMTG